MRAIESKYNHMKNRFIVEPGGEIHPIAIIALEAFACRIHSAAM